MVVVVIPEVSERDSDEEKDSRDEINDHDKPTGKGE